MTCLIWCAHHMGWLRLVGSLKVQVSFAEFRLLYRALLQKRPIVLRSLLLVATPYISVTDGDPKHTRHTYTHATLSPQKSHSLSSCNPCEGIRAGHESIYTLGHESIYTRVLILSCAIVSREKLRFLSTSWYKFKLRFWFDLNLYREIWVSRSGGFWVFGIFGGICDSCIGIVYSRRVLRSRVSQECIHYDGTRFK